MKLEIGKRYVTSDNKITARIREHNPPYASDCGRPLIIGDINGESRVFYADDGTRRYSGYCGDIVSEYVEPESVIPILESRITELEARVAELEKPEPFKLEVGKRYVMRDGSVTSPLVANEHSRYPLRDLITGSTFMVTGRWSTAGTSSRDLVSLYVEPAPFTIEVGKRYVTRDGRVTEPVFETLLEGFTLAAKIQDDPSAYRIYNADGTHARHIEALDLVSLYVEPVTPVPPSGYSLYRDEPAIISELRTHDSHEPIMHWSSANACWEAGLSRHGGCKFYAIKKGSALSYRCKLETLKLEAGKRYVLEDGRVTFPLCTDDEYPDTFVTGLDDDKHILHYWNSDGSLYNEYCTISSPISHPYES
jgi:hypothetical protein